jgi:adenine-specific DNA-methyltransferase
VARRKGKTQAEFNKRPIESYEHRDKERANNPPVGLVTPDTDPDAGQKKKIYAYDPHLDPQLVWAGKAEHTSFEVPTVSLHVHERIEPRTILEAVRKKNGQQGPIQQGLFEEERNEPLREAIEFYQHKHGWSNRLIAGDSLLVMNSLLEKEGMAGKVQMIYIDPPYGIKYGSNFQPFVNKRDVKDGKDEDLTAEPEQIRAFRDTWELGIHSYLTYLRDRLLLARELLTESGSIFVQISDENVHHVRELMDEVFGAGNFVSQIYFATTSGFATSALSRVGDYLLWYARDKTQLKYRQLFFEKANLLSGDEAYKYLELQDGTRRPMTREERDAARALPDGARIYRLGDLQSQGAASEDAPFVFQGSVFRPKPSSHWKASYPDGMERLKRANRIELSGNTLNFVRFVEDYPVFPVTNSWMDTGFAGFATDKRYVVETNTKVIARCLLMTTDPGDLVFDPTCGSGTTAYVAEQWGRRWITCDTSRVALAIARQRLMTAVFDYYELAHPEEGVGSGFKYKTVPHVTLKSIANNPEIDGIHARWTKKLEEFLVSSFEFLDKERVRQHLEKAEFGLLEQYLNEAAHADPELKTKNLKLRTLLAQRREQIDAAIARHADQETLYDQPYVDRKKVRVTGPFTVEAVPAPTVAPLEQFLVSSSQFSEPRGGGHDTKNSKQKTENYADSSIARSGETLRQGEWRDELLRAGIRGKAGQYIRFARLEPLPGCRFLHAEGETRPSAEGADSVRERGPAYDPMRVVVSFGPEHAPLEQRQVQRAWEEAQQLVPKPKLLVFAAFQFDPEAAKDIDEMKPELAGMQFLKVQMNADLLTDDLKKKRASNESFWLIGQPDVEVSSFEFLVLSGSEERIAEYGTFKELSGLDSLAKIHRLGWQDLFLYALLSQGRDIWAYLADQEGWDFHSGEYRGRSGKKQQRGIPTVSWNSPGLPGGIGDFAGDLAEFGISDFEGCRRVVELLRRNRQIIGRLEALAQLLSFPIRPSMKNWKLKTKNFYCVSVHGFDYYNTKTGQIESGGADKIAVWMLDTDYDGRSLYPRQVFFPMADDGEGWAKLARNLKAEIDEERIEVYRGTVSLPFEAGEHKRIAVKIVDDRGIESLKVMEVEA